MARTMHMLNSNGHVSIHWEEQNDAAILPTIEKMLAQGYKFFVLKEVTMEVMVPVEKLADVAEQREVVLDDAALQQLYDAGLLQVGGVTVDDDAETTDELANTPEAVVENDTLVTQPVSGG